MANTIRIKRSTGSSNPGSLENAEIAFREGDEVLVYGTGTGGAGGSATSIISIGGKGAFFDKATTRTTNHVLAGAASGFEFNGDSKVNGSIPVFNSSNNRFEATATHTVLTLVDGGNF